MISRRQALSLMGVTLGGGLVLAACGSSSKTTTAPTSAGTAGGGSGAGNVAIINQIFGPGGKAAGQGTKLTVGGALFLSGAAAYYGKVMSAGMELAAAQIAAAGGPTFHFTYRDIQSGSATAAAQDARAFGEAGVGVSMSSNAAVAGAELPGIEQYKIFTLDGGGGTGPAAAGEQGKPYFWGTRAISPEGPWPGLFMYIAKALPSAKKVFLASWIEGSLTTVEISTLQQILGQHGMSLVGQDLFAIGTSNFANTMEKIRSASPDIVLLVAYGEDPGVFMKQYVTSGNSAQVFGMEYTADAAKVAGSAYDKYYFAFDYFNAGQPDNDWAKYFVSSFQAKYGYTPDFYSANYYEDTFILWELTKQVLKAGGNPNKGPDMEKAMERSLSFPSVYGGSGATPGTISFSPQTHSVTSRPMGVFKATGGVPTALALFNIDGADFKMM